MRLWLEAMDRYERDALPDTSLATKGGAFIATFPGPDSESSIPRNPATETSDKGVVELNDEALAAAAPPPPRPTCTTTSGPASTPGSASSAPATTATSPSRSKSHGRSPNAPTMPAPTRRSTPSTTFASSTPASSRASGTGGPTPCSPSTAQSDLINVALADIQKTSVEPGKVVNLCRECAKDPNWPSKLYLPNSRQHVLSRRPTDSLDAHRSNSMDGAETIPDEPAGTVDQLEENPPLPEPKAQESGLRGSQRVRHRGLSPCLGAAHTRRPDGDESVERC